MSYIKKIVILLSITCIIFFLLKVKWAAMHRKKLKFRGIAQMSIVVEYTVYVYYMYIFFYEIKIHVFIKYISGTFLNLQEICVYNFDN